MYAKWGFLILAQEVFDRLPVRNVVCWTVLITGYAQYGNDCEALKCFEHVQIEGVSSNEFTLACVLKACSSSRAADKGQEVHVEIIKRGLLEKDTTIGNALVDMLMKCGLLTRAREILSKLPIRNVITWSTVIMGYALHGHGDQALNSYSLMQSEGIFPNVITFMCILKACSCLCDAKKGQEIHAEIVKGGLLQKDVIVGNALIDMYVKSGQLEKAHKVLVTLVNRNAISWSALIAGYSQHSQGKEALGCYEEMQLEGHSPNSITFISILKVCASIESANKGQEVHAEIAIRGLLGNDIGLDTALIDMYGSCGELLKAHNVFEDLPVHYVVSWNVLITCYANHGYGREALLCFQQMQLEGLPPNVVTYVCILKVCSNLGAVVRGVNLHAELVSRSLLGKDVIIGNALVDMYAKCGFLPRARGVFEELPARDVISWNALVTGYALLGNAESDFYLFDYMIFEGKTPDSGTFNVMLNVCSHTGLLMKGQVYLQMMCLVFHIFPSMDHYTCLLDMYGRTSNLEMTACILKELPLPPNLTVWHTLLGACQREGNVKLGRLAFKYAVQLDKSDTGVYISIINIYSDALK